jgi:hypothetical protein
MAMQTGAIKYRGSFKSIRNYMNLHDNVIQYVGVEFYLKSDATDYLPLKGSSMYVVDVF